MSDFLIIYYRYEYKNKEEIKMGNIYIQRSIKELRQLEELKEKVNKKIKVKEDVLKHYMIENGISELYGTAGEKVTYMEIESKRFDTSTFKKHFETLYNNYLKSTRNFRFKFSY